MSVLGALLALLVASPGVWRPTSVHAGAVVTLSCNGSTTAWCSGDSPLTLGTGGIIDVVGTNLDPYTTVVAWLDTVGDGVLRSDEPATGKLTSDATGTVTASIPVDDLGAGHVAGLYHVDIGVCPTDVPTPCAVTAFAASPISALASAPVVVNLQVGPHRIGSGSDETITGYGFPAGTPVTVWTEATDGDGIPDQGEPTTSVTTNASGAFTMNWSNLQGPPGTLLVRAAVDGTRLATGSVDIASCWFQDCMVNGVDNICLLGNAPGPLSDCKPVDSNFTALPSTWVPGSKGAEFIGAGALASMVNDFGPPPTGCIVMQTAITYAQSKHNTVPDAGFDVTKPLQDLTDIACGDGAPPPDLDLYATAEAALGNTVPDLAAMQGVVTLLQTTVIPLATTAVSLACTAANGAALLLQPLAGQLAATVGLDPGTATVLASALLSTGSGLCQAAALLVPQAVQWIFAIAAVTGAVACGRVDYDCWGADITGTVLGNAALQQEPIPMPFMQPPVASLSAPDRPNVCRPSVDSTAFSTEQCWGNQIGWSQVYCQVPPPDTGSCEAQAFNGTYPQLAVPGSAGDGNNGTAAIPIVKKCATGRVGGVSVGYDGDVGFDVWNPADPNMLSLVNYHNFQPGPGGTDPPDGIDIEVPPADQLYFSKQLDALQAGMTVHVCGMWVSDMHMLWNELHPVTSLEIVPSVQITSPTAGSYQPEGTTTVSAAVTDADMGTTVTGCAITWDGGTPVAGDFTSAGGDPQTGTCTASITGLAPGAHTVTVTTTGTPTAGSATASFIVKSPPVLAYPPSVTVSYSNSADFAVTATDALTADSLTVDGLPTGLTTLPQVSTFWSPGATAVVSGTVQAAAGKYPVTVVASDGINTPVTGTFDVVVTREQAVVSPAADNPTAVLVTAPGGSAGPITVKAAVTEAPSDPDYGDISLATPVTMSLLPVSSGTTYTCTATTGGGGVAGTLTAACTFPAGTAVNLYDLHVAVGGSYYTGTADSVLAVYDPSLGAATGGGFISRQGRRGDFGFVARYLKSGQLQGSAIYVEHDTLGDVVLKSNAMGSLVVSGGTTAYLTGKATLDGVGNYSFRVTAVDGASSGTPDQFGLAVNDPTGAPVGALTFDPVAIGGGAVVVPHRS